MRSAFGIEHGISKSMKVPGVGRVRFRTKTVHGKKTGTRMYRETEARVKGQKVASMWASLKPRDAGKILRVHTEEDLRRKGIATGMLRHLESVSPPKTIHHSNVLSPAGKAWAKKTPLERQF